MFVWTPSFWAKIPCWWLFCWALLPGVERCSCKLDDGKVVVSKKSIVETHAVLATVMWAIYLSHIGYKGRCTFCRIWVWVKTLSTLEEHHDINDSLSVRCLKTQVPGSYHPYTRNCQSIWLLLLLSLFFVLLTYLFYIYLLSYLCLFWCYDYVSDYDYLYIYIKNIYIYQQQILYITQIWGHMDMVTWWHGAWYGSRLGIPETGHDGKLISPSPSGLGHLWRRLVPPDWFRGAAGSFPLVIH